MPTAVAAAAGLAGRQTGSCIWWAGGAPTVAGGQHHMPAAAAAPAAAGKHCSLSMLQQQRQVSGSPGSPGACSPLLIPWPCSCTTCSACGWKASLSWRCPHHHYLTPLPSLTVIVGTALATLRPLAGLSEHLQFCPRPSGLVGLPEGTHPPGPHGCCGSAAVLQGCAPDVQCRGGGVNRLSSLSCLPHFRHLSVGSLTGKCVPAEWQWPTELCRARPLALLPCCGLLPARLQACRRACVPHHC